MTFNITVEREARVKNDKTYFTYFISANIRGKDVRISVMPPDTGGYRVLDIVFGNQNEATLVVTPFEIKDESTGKVVRGNTYSVQSVDLKKSNKLNHNHKDKDLPYHLLH